MRRGELLGLRWSDLDLTGGILAIRQTLQYVPGTGLVISPTKTPSSERRIALPREAIASLTRHRDQQRLKRLPSSVRSIHPNRRKPLLRH